ncbi:putative knottin, scorpion toxin-like superfamily [Helianthus anomalus]
MYIDVAKEETIDEMCRFLKWSGPCLKSKCSDACIRSGYVNGVCQNDTKPNNDDACYCLKPCYYIMFNKTSSNNQVHYYS